MSYRRLLPRERSLFRFAELWAGDDHLLSVRSYRLSEQYQRFPFSAIQSIAVTELPHWTARQIAALGVSGALFLASVALPSWTVFRVSLGLLTAGPLALALREVLRGPRCKTTIRTAAGEQQIPAVARMSRAPEFLAQVSELVERAQRGDYLWSLRKGARHRCSSAPEVPASFAARGGRAVSALPALLLQGMRNGA